MRAVDLNHHSIRLTGNEYFSDIYHYFGLHPIIIPGVFGSPVCELEGFKRDDRIDTDFVDGAEILTSTQWIAGMKTGFTLRFSIHGDFIRDRENLGADLDHLPQWLSNADPSEPTSERTGDGVEGGEFISWFSFTRERSEFDHNAIERREIAFIDNAFLSSMNTSAEANETTALAMLRGNPIAINSATRDELIALNGIGPELADAIIAVRNQAPIRNEVALLAIPGIGNSLLERIRNHISFEDGE